ncbi:MAG: SDR family oxidoreductase [Actinomycetia bacterium]|nr:SDR family oxidoreductase [Actinomycetes bacterium]
MTVALITGSNSGIGRGAAIELARRGWTVYGSMRSLDKGEKLAALSAEAGVEVRPVVLDVTDTGSVNAAVAQVTEDSGGIDVVINNAGVGGNGVTEECPIELYEQVMDANVYGGIRLIQAVLPQMRERGSGTIVNFSSVVGRVAHIAQSPYYVSKFAVEAMTEGLAQEVAPFGIRVCLIEPGITKSAIFAKNIDATNTTGAYDQQYGRMFQFYAAGIPHATPPEEVGAVIHEAVTTDDYKLRWPVSWGSEMIEARASLSDEDWVEMGRVDDAEYYARFSDQLGVDISPQEAG